MTGTRWLLGGRGVPVGWLWRLLGAGLAAGFVAATMNSYPVAALVYRLDTQLIDTWQRISPPDRPSGQVVVVGIDKAAITRYGRWPWPRETLSELVEAIVASTPKSITLDILLTEAGPYSDLSILRRFKENSAEVLTLRGQSGDDRLAAALRLAPTALAVAGSTRQVIDDGNRRAQCANPALVGPDAPRYYVECLLYPLDAFFQGTAEAVTLSDQDVDGVVRRARALIAQPFPGETGPEAVFIASLPLAVLTTCADPGVNCPQPTFDAAALSRLGGNGESFHLTLLQEAGTPPPALPLTDALSLWLDFGALDALAESTLSARAVMQSPEIAATLSGKNVIIGLTRLGEIDRHATPMANQAGTPGVIIQALAADNILTGRALDHPPWTIRATHIFAALIILAALLRYGVALMPVLTAVATLTVIGPVALSWLAFETAQMIFMPVTASFAAFLAGSPIIFGRMQAIRRDLAEAHDKELRDAERMDAARQIQLGSLPFEATFDGIGVETGKICRPAQEVGGDFFELFRLADGRLFAAVGDVSGKGLEASLVTALSKSISGAVADRTAGPVGEAMAAISQEFVRQAPREWRLQKGGFVTLVVLRLDPETGAAEFAAAGCEPPVVVAKDGTIRPVALPDVAPLGWVEDAAFETATLTLSPGDTVAMFTDGVTEAETPTGTLFGQDRAIETIRAAAFDGAAGVLTALDDAVQAHQAGHEPTDDTTILTVTFTGYVKSAE